MWVSTFTFSSVTIKLCFLGQVVIIFIWVKIYFPHGMPQRQVAQNVRSHHVTIELTSF